MSNLQLKRSLAYLLAPFSSESIDPSVVISGLALDSQKVQPGDLFIALQGSAQDGAAYISKAVARGAVAVLTARKLEVRQAAVPHIFLSDLSHQLGFIAARFYGSPSMALPVVAITGTSGKTSVCQLIAQALDLLGRSVGTIGTLGVGLVGDLHYGTGLTTPDAVTLQQYFKSFVAADAKTIVMEASSHGLEQGRMNGSFIDTAVFTNLTQDHLDYHQTMEAYGAAKASLFNWPHLKRAIINVDDPFGAFLSEQSTAKRLITTSIDLERSGSADLQVRSASYDLSGIQASIETPWGPLNVRSGLLGAINLANLLVVVGYLGSIGISLVQIEALLPQLKTIPGRLDRYGGGGKPTVFVDYAHKPDPLLQIVRLLKKLTPGRLFCVVGCGGDRDKGKRPLMAQAAAEADLAVITSDNPRTEEPMVIIEEMKSGLSSLTNILIEPNRAEAIAKAIEQAAAEDIVLVAGRGNETHQLIGHQKILFQDSEHVEQALYSWHEQKEMR